MEKTGKTIGIVERIALSCDAFTTGFSCMLVLFFLPYAAQYSYTAVLCVVPLACILPFVVMPVLYAVIHRTDFLLFGRYHLVMPVSAFCSALFFVFVFSSTAVGAGGACFILFGAVLLSVALPLYRYCAYSVRVRLGGDGVIGGSRATGVFSAIGAAATVGVFVGFYYYDAGAAYLNTSYVLGAASLILALFQYLTTYYGIPRLGGKRVQPIKSVFITLFRGIDGRVFSCVLLFDAAFLAAAALVVYACVVLGAGVYIGVACAAALVVAFFATSIILSKFFADKRTRLYAIAFVALFLGAALCAIAMVVPVGEQAASAMLGIGAAFIGASGSAAMRQTRVRLVSVKPDITSGIAFLLFELIILAAMGIALSVGAATATVFTFTFSRYAVFGGFCCAIALSISAISIAAHKSVRAYKPRRVTYEPYAEITEDRMGRTSNDE